MNLPELVAECKAKQQKEYKEFLEQKYLATGEWYLDQIDTERKDTLVFIAWSEYKTRCKILLDLLAYQSGDPLVQWMAAELSNSDTAFNLIKRLPMDLKQIDELATRSGMDCKAYRDYRVKALEAGVVTEYRMEEVK